MNSTLFTGRADFAAAGLSAACIIHCLALPLIGAAMPIVGVWAEIEWIHKALVLLAAPISLYAIFGRTSARGGRAFGVIALFGLTILFAAAFAESLHDYEQPLTAAGGLILGGAHIAWWLKHRTKMGKPRSAD